MLRELIKTRERNLSSHIEESESEVGVWIDFRYLPRQDEEPTHQERRNFLERADVYLTKPSAWFPILVWWLVAESEDGEPTSLPTGDEMNLHGGIENVRDELQVSRPANNKPWTNENINLVRSHLATVNFAPPTASFVPTRLLDVGLSSESNISLTTTPDTHSDISYAALSYCWGPPDDALKQPKLLTSNIANLHANIPPTLLSPVMLDAITVCRDLQIPYLWIDALCIIQDSKTDWEQESQVMARVYANASLTICAMSSSSCLLPFLGPRPSWSNYPYSSPSIPRGTFRLRPVPGYNNPDLPPHPILKTTPLDQDLAASRWSQRGWVFQEKAMSPRKLFFGDTMLHLQFDDRIVDSENGVRIYLRPHAYDINKNTLYESSIPIGPLLRKKRHVYELWHAAVVGFANLQWTNGMDLFPGLSGIAERFRAGLGGARYLAGHWEGDLHNSLVWATTQRRDAANRDFSLVEVLVRLRKGNASNAPSWSWASRPDFFRFVISSLDQKRCRVRTHLRPEMEAVRATIRVDGTNDLGRLQSGNSLAVVGKMIGLAQVTARPDWQLRENAEWECANIGKGYLISISRDWEAKRKGYGSGTDWPPQGATDEEMGTMRLLLMASCCSDVVKLADGVLKPGTVDVYKALNRLDFGNTFLAEPDFRVGKGRCVFCDEEGRRRDVWGLLLYPAGENRYFRVGIFFSRAQHGGSAVFDGAETCQVDLV